MEKFLERWTGNFTALVWDIIIAAAALIIGLIAKYIIKAVLNYYKKRDDYSLFRSVVAHIGRPANHFIPLLVLNMMLPLMDLPPRYAGFLNRLVEIALIISFSIILIAAVDIFEDYIFHIYDLSKSDNLKERKIRTQIQFIKKTLAVLIIFITIAVILLSFDNVRKIGAGLLTSVGIGGIIIGFAAQKSLANFLAGFQIAFTQPIRIDDILIVEGEYGHVEEITLTYVVLNIWDERRMILPINYFIEKPFQNWTRTSAELLGTIFLYFDYSVPVDAIRGQLDKLLADNPLWDKRVKGVQITDAKQNCIEVRVLVSAGDSSKAYDLRCYIRENLVKFVKDNYPESLPVTRVFFNNPNTVSSLPSIKTDKQ
jgi:small-conductance mechanosensitive channel